MTVYLYKTPVSLQSSSNTKENVPMNANATPILPSSTKPRIEFIDLLKAFGIFCVLWGHSMGDLRTSNDEWFFLADPILKFFITYHMPLFFMISGFFFVSSLNLSFKEVFRKRFTYLIIPHITWSILIALTNWAMSLIGWETPFSDKPFTILSRIQALFNPDPSTELWFFKDLFLTSLIVFVACKIFRKRYVAFIVSMLFVLLFNFFGFVGKMQRFMMPIFWAGVLLKVYYPVFSKHLNKLLIGSGIVFVACVYFYDYTYEIYLIDFPALIHFQQSLSEGTIVFDVTNIGISIFRSLTGIVGSVFFFALFQRFWKKNAVTSFLSGCGQLTVGIYGIQAILLQRVMHNLLDFANVNIWIYRLFISSSCAAFVFFVSVLLTRLIQRNQRLAFVLFGGSGVYHKIRPLENQAVNSDNDRVYQSV
jgi:fucose 4-O-acetylase-like acetyltransferase